MHSQRPRTLNSRQTKAPSDLMGGIILTIPSWPREWQRFCTAPYLYDMPTNYHFRKFMGHIVRTQYTYVHFLFVRTYVQLSCTSCTTSLVGARAVGALLCCDTVIQGVARLAASLTARLSMAHPDGVVVPAYFALSRAVSFVEKSSRTAAKDRPIFPNWL